MQVKVVEYDYVKPNTLKVVYAWEGGPFVWPYCGDEGQFKLEMNGMTLGNRFVVNLWPFFATYVDASKGERTVKVSFDLRKFVNGALARDVVEAVRAYLDVMVRLAEAASKDEEKKSEEVFLDFYNKTPLDEL